MATCPRCGNDADYLPGDVFTLITCEFCGDTIDATGLGAPDDADRAIRLLPTAAEQPQITRAAQVA
jgi:hypothetical protein